MRGVLLSKRQVNLIHDLLLHHGVKYDSLRMDLQDHLCCMVEEQMNEGVPFEEALHASVGEFGPDGLQETQEATVYLLTLKFRKMKRIMSVTGLLGGVLACVGVLLKLMHLPMANVCLVVGISFISLIYLPLLLVVKLREIESTILKIAHVVGILAGMLFGMSVMFKFMHWPYANVMMVITLVIMGLIFMPVYFTHSYKLTENKLSSLAFMAVLLAAVFGLYGLAQPAASKTMDQSLYVMHQTLITDLDRVEQEREEVMRQTAEEWREFNTETSELLDYIKGMRAKSVALTQDVDLAEAENMNLQSMEWGDNAGQLQRMLTDAGSKYNADELEQRLGAWKASAVSAGVSEEKVGHWALTEPVVVEGSKQLSWKEAYFSEATIVSLVTYLDHLALEVNQRYIQVAG